MSEKSEKKAVKGFRISEGTQKVVNDLIKNSGKEDWEWFEDLIQQISSNELVLEKSGVPLELRKHFGSDLASIKDATNLITSLFLTQMNRIAVEKNTWDKLLQTRINEYEERLTKHKNDIATLEHTVQQKDDELEDNQNTILQLHNKVEGFDKLETQLRKDIERLEGDNNKTSQELQRVKDESVGEKEKHYKDLDELKGAHKEEKDRLNQQIVDLVEQLKKVEPLNEENRKLQEKIKELDNDIIRNNADYEMKITRMQEQAELDKEKALLVRERELREQLYIQNREDMKELYDKIEKLQVENNQLRIQGK
jgi:chromosome segregation ATPase